MTWTAPATWTTNQTVTSAQLNAQLRDNMLETAPAKSTAGAWPQHFVVSGTNVIAAREVRDDIVSTSQNSTSTSYTDLATVGPSVTLTTGSFAMTFHATATINSSTGLNRCSIDISGNTTSAPVDGRAAMGQGTDDMRIGVSNLFGINPGAGNVFTLKYRVSANTGTWGDRRLQGMAL